MAGNFSTTARNALRYLLGTSKVSDVDEGFQRLAEDVDTKMVSFWEDTFAKRPAAGQPNRIFRASDTGIIYHDTGTIWEQLFSTGSMGPYTQIVVTKAEIEAGTVEPSATRATFVSWMPNTFNSTASQVGIEVNGHTAWAAEGKTPGWLIVPPGGKLKSFDLVANTTFFFYVCPF